MLFFDTSALVKRYATEPGTETVDELIDSTDQSIVITTLSVIEMTSAVRRKQNVGRLTERQRDDLLAAFFTEATRAFTIVPVDDDAFVEAFELVLEDDLRTLDALQLGSALYLVDPALEPTFVCADENLVTVASKRGLPTIDPTANG